MSMRIRRLYAEQRGLEEAFAADPIIEVRPVAGDPPERYRVTYHVKGLELRQDGTIIVRDRHEVEVTLTSEYPRRPPVCKMLTPVFHPNIDAFEICISDHWASQERVTDIVVRVGRMIAYQTYNLQSPLNGRAAKWCDRHRDRLPVDPVDFTSGRGIPRAPAKKTATVRSSSSGDGNSRETAIRIDPAEVKAAPDPIPAPAPS